VRDNNTKVDQFPSNLIANAMSFAKADFFKLADTAAHRPVEIKFD